MQLYLLFYYIYSETNRITKANVKIYTFVSSLSMFGSLFDAYIGNFFERVT